MYMNTSSSCGLGSGVNSMSSHTSSLLLSVHPDQFISKFCRNMLQDAKQCSEKLTVEIDFLTATIKDIQELLSNGTITSVQLVQASEQD
jgi:hypothetical protein